MVSPGRMVRRISGKGTSIMRTNLFADRLPTHSTTLGPRERRAVRQTQAIAVLYMVCLFGAVMIAHALFDATPQTARDAVEAAFNQ
jgi:hypothetical protein